MPQGIADHILDRAPKEIAVAFYDQIRRERGLHLALLRLGPEHGIISDAMEQRVEIDPQRQVARDAGI